MTTFITTLKSPYQTRSERLPLWPFYLTRNGPLCPPCEHENIHTHTHTHIKNRTPCSIHTASLSSLSVWCFSQSTRKYFTKDQTNTREAKQKALKGNNKKISFHIKANLSE